VERIVYMLWWQACKEFCIEQVACEVAGLEIRSGLGYQTRELCSGVYMGHNEMHQREHDWHRQDEN